ncbi:hypothetical protein C6P42_001039 [Pichia californica]|nr:hypothetical protein C6P42_001039 [[Candida] californica]
MFTSSLTTIFTFILLIASRVSAGKFLYSNSLVNCMKNNTDIIPNYFSVIFDAEDRSITYDISLTANIQGKLKAYATVYAFGFDIIHETVDLCNLNLKQFCPITPSEMEVESIEYISSSYVDKIPGIAYTFPDLDAVARLIITNDDNELLGCLQASFNNGKTVSHEGAKWALACVAGLGLLISGLLSIFGNSASASRMSAAALSLFTYFQSVVIIAMISVDEVPPIANSWAENLAWSMGLIRIHFMQQIFRWYVQATGGTPTQYLTTKVYSVLTQRSFNKILNNYYINSIYSFFFPAAAATSKAIIDSGSSPDLVKRISSDTDTSIFIPLNHVQSNDYLKVLRGIKRIGYNSNIEPTSIVCTGFTFFTLCLYVLIGVFFIYRYLTTALTKGQRKNWISKNIEQRTSWRPVFKGMLARYIFIGFPQLLILSLYEFTAVDSGAVVTIAVFFLILSVGTMALCCVQVIRYGRKSIIEHGNPAAILYGNPEVLGRYGFLYTMLNAKRHWFCCVSLAYLFVKALFVALSQSSGRTQAMALWILDMFYLGLMCHFLPYLDTFTNVLFIFIQVITTINSFFFTFFSGIYGQPLRVASVMGLVFFIMNAAVSVLLLIMIFVLAIFTIFSKNPDARFSPAKDDRTSFQRKHNSLDGDNMESNELFELGRVAKEHDDNWANNMYDLQDMDNRSSSNDEQLDTPEPDERDKKYSDAKILSDDTVDSSDYSNHKRGLSNIVGKFKGKSFLGLPKGKSQIALSAPDHIFGSKSNLADEHMQSNDSLDVASTGRDIPIDTTHDLDDYNDEYEDPKINKDPFQSNNSLKSNPFNTVLDTPYEHERNNSHLSDFTTNTGAGLSVYGERINPNDFTSHNDKFGIHSGLQSNRNSTIAESQVSGNTQYYDDIDSENSDAAHRRFK